MEPGAYGSFSKGYPALLALPPLPPKRRLVAPVDGGEGANKRARRCSGCPTILPPTGTRGHPRVFCVLCAANPARRQVR